MSKLREARKQRGLTQVSLADLIGVSQPHLARLERGQQKGSRDLWRKIAATLDTPLADLIDGDGDTVPIVGFVGAGEALTIIDDHEQGAGLEQIDAPPGLGDEAVAVRVRGNSMSPQFNDGDVLIYDRHVGIEEAIGRRCVVRLVDGRAFVKTVKRGAKRGTVTLVSHNADPIEDVSADWIAPIAWVRPL